MKKNVPAERLVLMPQYKAFCWNAVETIFHLVTHEMPRVGHKKITGLLLFGKCIFVKQTSHTMAFEYSSFISYRHNDLNETYFENLKDFLKSEVFSATNIAEIFYDKVSIKWGVLWDNKIYSGIEESFFFLPVWYYHYLNEDNLWCARELYHALEIEKIIRNQLTPKDQDKFAFIFPLIYKGSAELIPSCLSEKNAKSLVGYEIPIKTKKVNKKFQDVINNIYDTLLEQYLILEKYAHVDFQTLFQQIKRPSDAEIKEWIKAQKKNIAQKEAGRPPVLNKNGE